MCPIASRHIMPTASCVEYIENAIVCFSIIGPLSSNDRLRWNMLRVHDLLYYSSRSCQ